MSYSCESLEKIQRPLHLFAFAVEYISPLAIWLFLFFQVSFTGSTEAGRKVAQAAAASNLKVVSLELGGKSPLLIFDDADVDMAAELALIGILYNKVNVSYLFLFP